MNLVGRFRPRVLDSAYNIWEKKVNRTADCGQVADTDRDDEKKERKAIQLFTDDDGVIINNDDKDEKEEKV